jgi:Ca2+-binding RTX toxin-like protein
MRVFVVRERMTEGRMKKGLLAGLIGLVATLALAPAALASSVTVTSGTTVRVVETGTEVNRIGVSYDGGTDLYTVTDATANLNPTGTCVAVDAHTATCPGAGIKTISVDTDALGDSIGMDLASIPSTVSANFDGGSGDDAVSGHGSLDGGSGNDQVLGSPMADTIRGGSGKDTLDGGDGPDDIAGGSSTDALSYPASRITPVNITVGSGNFNDGGAEDQGSSGRRDTVHGDIEVVIGTAQADLIAGDSSSETLIGGLGNDVLDGNRGNDTLLGLEGDDVLVGDEGSDLVRGWLGADRLFGGRGNDRVSGGPDNDFVVGNSGHDVLKGKSGIDLLRAKDGTRDFRIKCGPGNNRLEGATRDRHLDPRAKSC